MLTIYWRRQWHPTPVLLPGKSHGRRSLVGCSPWGHYKSDTTEKLHFHALEKEMATYSSVLAWRIPGTGQPGGLLSMGSYSQTRQKRLSSSSYLCIIYEYMCIYTAITYTYIHAYIIYIYSIFISISINTHKSFINLLNSIYWASASCEVPFGALRDPTTTRYLPSFT